MEETKTTQQIPEIRIRKGSDAPPMAEIRGTAPLASAESEGLSEVESCFDNDEHQSEIILSPTVDIPYKQVSPQCPDGSEIIDEGDDITLHACESDDDNDVQNISDNIVINSDEKDNYQEISVNTLADVCENVDIPEESVQLETMEGNKADVCENVDIQEDIVQLETMKDNKELEETILEHPETQDDREMAAFYNIKETDEDVNPEYSEEYSQNNDITPENACGSDRYENYTYTSGQSLSEIQYDDTTLQCKSEIVDGESFEVYETGENFQSGKLYSEDQYGEANLQSDEVVVDYEQFQNEHVDESFNYQYEIQEGGDDPFDLTYIKKKRESDAANTCEVETPINSHILNLETQDESDPSVTPDTFEDENEISDKIKISLPGSQFKQRAKSPTNKETRGPPVIGPPPRPKGPVRPPPPSVNKPSRPPPPGRPQRPGPTKKQSGWESFESGTSLPTRPPPPKKSPARPAPPRKGDGESPAVTKEAAEDETAILDTGAAEKKKSKIKPGKAIKVLVHGKDYKEKKEKKEKARQHQRELMSKFVKDDESQPSEKEHSEEWKQYQEMLGKSDHDLITSKEKLNKLEAGFQREMSKLWGTPVSTASNSPWQDQRQDSVIDAPIEESGPAKIGWVGFEDDFSKAAPYKSGSAAPTASPKEVKTLPKSPTKEGDLLGIGSEVTLQKDIEINTITSNTEVKDPLASDYSETDGSAGLNIVDDFLCISSEAPTSNTSVPVDPLEKLQAMKKKEIETDVSGCELDEIFGFGDKKSDDCNAEISKDNLFDIEAEDTENIDPFTVDVEKVQKEEEEKLKEESNIETTTIPTSESLDDFDPRGDINVKELDVKPVEDDTPKWTSPISTKRARPRPKRSTSKTGDNPFTSTGAPLLLRKPGENQAAHVPNPFADLVGDSDTSEATSTTQSDSIAPKQDQLVDLGIDFGIANDDLSATGTSRQQHQATDSAIDLLGGALTSEPETGDRENNEAAEGATDFNPYERITDDTCYEGEDGERTPTCLFDPFKTITDEDEKVSPAKDDSFNPFATISGEDAFVADFSENKDRTDGDGSSTEPSPQRFNPFNKETSLDNTFANFETEVKRKDSEKPETRTSVSSQKGTTSETSFTEEEEEEELVPLDPFHPPFTGDGWNLFIRLPTGGKKKITQNRYWKPVYVRLLMKDDNPCLKIFNNEKTPEVMQEVTFQPNYNMCNMGLQQYDQFGKCHTVKIEQVVYRERVGVKAERLTPTLSDLSRVRDFRGLKDLVHKPKTSMLLDHAPQRQELFKFGSLIHEVIMSFVQAIEDAFFHMKIDRSKTSSYTKDEITVEVVDEYHCELDAMGHIKSHKARVRLYAISFLSGIPLVEVGVNDKRRRGKEVVGRHDIIPIKTEEWVRIENPEMHYSIDKEEFEKTKVVKFRPIDAARYEIFRCRVRPSMNKELPLQVRTVQSLIDKHYEIKCDVMIPGYYTNSRRAAQVPCEDIQIHFPIPEQWVYYFRVEKHFRYGSLHSTTRKAGKIKGFERLTMIAKGLLPPTLIEVSTGMAKYEHLFRSIVWRIPRLPERNEGAYKTHTMLLRLDLGPHDPIPSEFANISHVEYNMPNSTLSRAQVRSISISNLADDPPDRWVRHLAKYSYNVEMEWCDSVKKSVWEETDDPKVAAAGAVGGAEGEVVQEELPKVESDSDSSTDSD